jgi:hypothetical protein
MCTEYRKGFITPKETRQFAHLGETKSEKVLSSNLLKRWHTDKKLIKMKKGTYKFVEKAPPQEAFDKLLGLLRERNI